jgi:hypothetical protein
MDGARNNKKPQELSGAGAGVQEPKTRKPQKMMIHGAETRGTGKKGETSRNILKMNDARVRNAERDTGLRRSGSAMIINNCLRILQM